MTQDEALTILLSGCNVFLTGEPGSGKSHVVGRYIAHLRKEGEVVSVTASTGIAAAHIGGTTIHAWSGIGMKSQLSRSDFDTISKNRRTSERIKKAKVLIIDEISMLSGQTLTAVDQVAQYIRKSNAPFGGLQVVLVGDFFQLPPIVSREERASSFYESQDSNHTDSLFAYASRCWQSLDLTVCYLTEQHRQHDATFSELLGAIRASAFNSNHFQALEACKPRTGEALTNPTRLYTHNLDVDRINLAELSKLSGDARCFSMTTTGDKILADGLKRGCLSPEMLELKTQARVMFTKNDLDGRFVNGTLGVVTGFDPDEHYPIVETQQGGRVIAKPAEWKISEDDGVKAGIAQVPLRLAWAITVHKSQGMSLDSALIDLSNAFEYGQGYVALSRVRSLNGLHLLGWNAKALRVHPDVVHKDIEFREASAVASQNLVRTKHTSLGDAQRQPSLKEAKAGAQSRSLNPKIKSASGNNNKAWTSQEDALLTVRFNRGESLSAIAAIHGRPVGKVRERLAKLGLILG